ncbi:hypothetical protein BKA56DRAFT_604170 [Ilyonectria sp. MPI-CAGE-AT-0026]|nr:hypothetical protein BKA56DRAFT_604170 [Ilyonectria sp. MPI-CAGE-AT-0026]
MVCLPCGGCTDGAGCPPPVPPRSLTGSRLRRMRLTTKRCFAIRNRRPVSRLGPLEPCTPPLPFRHIMLLKVSVCP